MKQIVAWLVLALAIGAGIYRQAPPTSRPLPTHRPVVPVVVHGLDAASFLAAKNAAAVGLLPLRAGRPGENWPIDAVLETGSRSPVARHASGWHVTERTVTTIGELDALLGERSASGVVVVAVGVDGAEREALGPVIIAGEGVPTGQLTSPSTGFRPGLIAATDIAATVMWLTEGQGNGVGAGRRAVVVAGTADDVLAQGQVWTAQAASQRTVVVLPWLLAVLVVASVRWPLLHRFVLGLVLAVLVAPTVVHGTVLFVAIVASALLLAWKLTPTGLAAAITGVLLLAVLVGGPVLDRTPLSYSVTEATRFHGLGNETAGLLLGAALVATEGSVASVALPILGAVALTIGLPTLGANFGCLLAALAGFVVRAVAAIPEAHRRRGGLVLVAVAFVSIAAMVIWDSRRGVGSRSHIGAVVTKDRASVVALAVRKLAMNGYLVTHSPWSVLLAAQVGVLVVRVVRRERLSRPQCVAAAVGFVTNDSGVLFAATCLLAETTTPSGGTEQPKGVEEVERLA